MQMKLNFDDNKTMAIGRTNTMQELISSLEALYGETIIGTDINLIKHLFYYLRFENAEFSFEYNDKYMSVIVHNVLQDFVELNVPDFMDGTSRRAKIKFEIINVLYIFEVIIEDTRGPIIKIKLPTELQSAEMRSHRRVICDDLFMDFVILFKSFKGGKYVSGDNSHAERQFTHLVREVKNDIPDINLLNKILTEYILKISSEYEFVIYKSGDGNDFIRNILSKDNKSIYIGDCSNSDSYIENTDSKYYKTYFDTYQEKSEEIGPFQARKFFEVLQKKENRAFLVSYIISPITLFDKVIGHLKVFTTAMDKHMLTKFHLEYIHELTEIFSYGLTKISIKGNSFNETYTNTKIVDISISGLLFEINDESLFQYLKKHSSIKMYIPMGKHKLEIKSEIVRFIPSEDGFKVGVSFINSNPGDMKILENYIYERKGNILSE
jgi:hypothetical protein